MTKKEEPPVTVNIGTMRYFVEENMLKPQQRKRLPLTLCRTADGEQLLHLVPAKHSMHNGNEIVHSSPSANKLLYPDETEVKKTRRI